MLFFRSEAGIAAWCRQRNIPQGEILDLDQLWTLAKAWYHNRMDPQFRGRSVEEVSAIFRGVGLISPFWYLDPPEA